MRCIDLTCLDQKRRIAKRRRRSRLQALALFFGVLSILMVGRAVRAQESQDVALPVLSLPERSVDGCQDLELAAENAPEPTKVEIAGVLGMWFPMVRARLVLCEHRELTMSRRELDMVDTELGLWDFQAQTYRIQSELAVAARDHYESVVVRAEERAADAVAEAESLSNNPVLWVGVGMGVMLAIIIGMAAALTKLAD